MAYDTPVVPTTTSGKRQSDDEKLQEALDRFKLTAEAEQDQRERELDDLRFDAGDQWPDDIKQQRAGNVTGVSGAQPVPARPCLTINKLIQPIQQVTNQQRSAKVALEFAPKGAGADQKVAETMEDIARAIQTESRAPLARNWAFERAIRCGRGFYRLLTEYANDGDDDLDIVYKRILNQAAVYFDPFCTEPDWSDAEWCFITEDMPFTRYQRLFPDSAMADLSSDELTSIGDEQPEWVKDTDAGKSVRIAEYFYLEHHKKLVTTPSGRQREVDARVVKWCKLNAYEILEAQDWPGRYIPVVPVIGQEFNVNGVRSWQGIVRPAKDAQRSYNVMRSAQVETIGLSTRAPYQLDPEQIEGYEQAWEQSNTRNFPYLPRKAFDARGNPYPPIQRDMSEPPIQAITMAVREADGDVKATTGIFDASLGNLNPADRSGKAILALQKQAEMGSSGFLDNLAHMSMVYEGKILRDLIPKIYNRPGRMVSTMGADDQRGSVILNQPFLQQGGNPTPVPEGTQGAKVIDLSQGEYSVIGSVGKSFTTRREESASAMGELISAVPQLVGVIGDLFVAAQDWPGSQQAADRMKKMLPPQLQEQGSSPEVQLAQLTEQARQAQQVIDAMTKELEAKTRAIETDQVKRESELRKTALELASDEKIAQMKIEADLLKTQATIAAQEATINLEAQIAQIQQELGFLREKEMLAAQQAQEATAQGAEQQFAAEQAEQDRGLQAGMQSQQLDAQAQMAQQQAEPPAEGP